MKTDEIKSLLAKADAALEQISVSGTGVYAMVEARSVLKRAYNITREPEH